MNLMYRLTVSTEQPVPDEERNRARLYGGALIAEFRTVEVLNIALTPEEFHAVRMAVLSEMSPKKDAR